MATAKRGGSPKGDEQSAEFEQELAGYLQDRIKPGLNSGAIPLLARSIAKEIAHREPFNGVSGGDDEEAKAEGDEKPGAEADDEPDAKSGEEPDAKSGEDGDEEPDAESGEDPDAESGEDPDAESDEELTADAGDDEDGRDDAADFEADMRDFQAELGEDWILRFSVQGDDAWLTAEKDDGSQRVEAPTAEVLSEAVKLLNERGGRSS